MDKKTAEFAEVAEITQATLRYVTDYKLLGLQTALSADIRQSQSSRGTDTLAIGLPRADYQEYDCKGKG